MPVPKSFSEFQNLFESIPVEDPGATQERNEKMLEIATSAILADLQRNENLRDAVIRAFPNLENNTVLLEINPTLEAIDVLVEFLSKHPRIERYALGARKRKDGERVRAIKLEVVEREDECEAPDDEDEKKKEREQASYKDRSKEDDESLSTTFFRGPSEKN
jgi:hypothetical protein